MKTKLFLFLVFLLVNKNTKAQTWQPLGPDDFSQTGSIGVGLFTSLASNGIAPYVIYSDVINSGKATVKKFNGTSWEAVGTSGFSDGSASFTSIAFNSGVPYVIYREELNGLKATVKKFNGSSWEVVGIGGFSAASTMYSEIVFNGNTPYVVYGDGLASGRVTVQKFNGTSWEVVGTRGFSAGSADHISVVSNGGTLYVVYSDSGYGAKAVVQRFNGTSWEIVGSPGFSSGTAYYSSIAFNGGIPYVVYQDESQGRKATVQKFNGTSWEVVGTSGFSVGAISLAEIVFNGSTPYVVYKDEDNGAKAMVQKFNGTSWEVAGVGTTGFSAGLVTFTSMVINGSDLVVAYSNEYGSIFAKRFPLSTLPVNLISFEANVKHQKQVNLSFKTASENNNDYFTIQKSKDGKTFETLRTVKSKGNSGDYETIDFSPSQGISYYKLSQTDLDGKTEELGIKTVKLETLNKDGLTVYPNPVVGGILNISNTTLKGAQSINIYDLSGKEVLQDQVIFSNGFAEFKINIKLAKGTYLLNIGSFKLRTRIIIE